MPPGDQPRSAACFFLLKMSLSIRNAHIVLSHNDVRENTKDGGSDDDHREKQTEMKFVFEP